MSSSQGQESSATRGEGEEGDQEMREQQQEVVESATPSFHQPQEESEEEQQQQNHSSASSSSSSSSVLLGTRNLVALGGSGGGGTQEGSLGANTATTTTTTTNSTVNNDNNNNAGLSHLSSSSSSSSSSSASGFSRFVGEESVNNSSLNSSLPATPNASPTAIVSDLDHRSGGGGGDGSEASGSSDGADEDINNNNNNTLHQPSSFASSRRGQLQQAGRRRLGGGSGSPFSDSEEGVTDESEEEEEFHLDNSSGSSSDIQQQATRGGVQQQQQQQQLAADIEREQAQFRLIQRNIVPPLSSSSPTSNHNAVQNSSSSSNRYSTLVDIGGEGNNASSNHNHHNNNSSRNAHNSDSSDISSTIGGGGGSPASRYRVPNNNTSNPRGRGGRRRRGSEFEDDISSGEEGDEQQRQQQQQQNRRRRTSSSREEDYDDDEEMASLDVIARIQQQEEEENNNNKAVDGEEEEDEDDSKFLLLSGEEEALARKRRRAKRKAQFSDLPGDLVMIVIYHWVPAVNHLQLRFVNRNFNRIVENNCCLWLRYVHRYFTNTPLVATGCALQVYSTQMKMYKQFGSYSNPEDTYNVRTGGVHDLNKRKLALQQAAVAKAKRQKEIAANSTSSGSSRKQMQRELRRRLAYANNDNVESESSGDDRQHQRFLRTATTATQGENELSSSFSPPPNQPSTARPSASRQQEQPNASAAAAAAGGGGGGVTAASSPLPSQLSTHAVSSPTTTPQSGEFPSPTASSPASSPTHHHHLQQQQQQQQQQPQQTSTRRHSTATSTAMTTRRSTPTTNTSSSSSTSLFGNNNNNSNNNNNNNNTLSHVPTIATIPETTLAPLVFERRIAEDSALAPIHVVLLNHPSNSLSRTVSAPPVLCFQGCALRALRVIQAQRLIRDVDRFHRQKWKMVGGVLSVLMLFPPETSMWLMIPLFLAPVAFGSQMLLFSDMWPEILLPHNVARACIPLWLIVPFCAIMIYGLRAMRNPLPASSPVSALTVSSIVRLVVAACLLGISFFLIFFLWLDSRRADSIRLFRIDSLTPSVSARSLTREMVEFVGAALLNRTSFAVEHNPATNLFWGSSSAPSSSTSSSSNYCSRSNNNGGDSSSSSSSSSSSATTSISLLGLPFLIGCIIFIYEMFLSWFNHIDSIDTVMSAVRECDENCCPFENPRRLSSEEKKGLEASTNPTKLFEEICEGTKPISAVEKPSEEVSQRIESSKEITRKFDEEIYNTFWLKLSLLLPVLSISFLFLASLFVALELDGLAPWTHVTRVHTCRFGNTTLSHDAVSFGTGTTSQVATATVKNTLFATVVTNGNETITPFDVNAVQVDGPVFHISGSSSNSSTNFDHLDIAPLSCDILTGTRLSTVMFGFSFLTLCVALCIAFGCSWRKLGSRIIHYSFPVAFQAAVFLVIFILCVFCGATDWQYVHGDDAVNNYRHYIDIIADSTGRLYDSGTRWSPVRPTLAVACRMPFTLSATSSICLFVAAVLLGISNCINLKTCNSRFYNAKLLKYSLYFDDLFSGMMLPKYRPGTVPVAPQGSMNDLSHETQTRTTRSASRPAATAAATATAAGNDNNNATTPQQQQQQQQQQQPRQTAAAVTTATTPAEATPTQETAASPTAAATS